MARPGCDGKFGYLLLSIILSVCLAEDLDADSTTVPEVTIPQGTLQGMNMVTRNSRDVYGFLGVPFAEPPVGDLRFKAPVAPSPWSGIWNASSDSADCAQMAGTSVSGSEDCLYLNVFTPQLPTSENSTLLPVMMFVYGGAFRAGGNAAEDYGPEYLLDQDVLLVVPSYRLGPLGFLSTGDEASPGNYGLKDLVRVLEWIQDNIKYFGGDSSQVTVFGQSAGGIITHLLALSPLTEGLAQRYISESGTALSFDGNIPKEVLAKRTITVGEYLGCPTNTSTDLVDCLRDSDLSELLATESLFYVWDCYPGVIWSPTTEPDIEGAFLTQSPRDLLDAGNIHDFTFMTSVNHDEGIGQAANYYKDSDSFDELLENFDTAFPAWLTYDTKVENVEACTNILKSYYLNDFTADREVLLHNLTQLLTDALCAAPSYNVLQKQLAHSQNRQYLASFEYRGVLSYSAYTPADGLDDHHVCHGDEMIYFFPMTMAFSRGSTVRSETDWEMVDTMVELWTSFAITGTPSTTVWDNTVIWEEYSALNNYLQIGNYSDITMKAQENFAKERMAVWEEFQDTAIWL